MRVNTDRNLPKMSVLIDFWRNFFFSRIHIFFLTHFRTFAKITTITREHYRAIKRAATCGIDMDFRTATIETIEINGIASGTSPRIRSSNKIHLSRVSVSSRRNVQPSPSAT